MNFIFQHPTECNLYLIRDFNANQDLIDPDSEVKIYRQVMSFTEHDLNSILGIHEVDSFQLGQLNTTPPYAAIRHLLYGNRLMAR